MRFSWHRLVVLLVASVAALQVFHMSLLSRVENNQKRPSFNSTTVTLSSSRETVPTRQPGGTKRRRSSVGEGDLSGLKQELIDMADAVRVSSVLDSSGDYKIINNLVQSDRDIISRIDQRQSQYGEDVTLVTQCSADQLYHLSKMAEYWSGPISVAVFVANNLVSTLTTIWRLRNCDRNKNNATTHLLRTYVSFHLVYPLSSGDDDDHHGLVDFDGRATLTCGDDHQQQSYGDESVEAKVSAINYERGDNNYVPYPNNLLRNVARQNAATEFVFVVDVDMVPSRDLRQQFVTFAQTNDLFGTRFNNDDDKSAYVVPAYELLDSAVLPDNKRQLLEAVTESRARPFYVEVCAKCQKHTDYETWEREPMSLRLAVLFDVLWKDPWEPFYLARNTVPAYDERFKQYGFNRISQVCEAHVAGYKFSVLNNAFLVHKGLKTVDSFHKKKAIDQERNRLLFRQFKVELKEKYPESFRRCY